MASCFGAVRGGIFETMSFLSPELIAQSHLFSRLATRVSLWTFLRMICLTSVPWACCRTAERGDVSIGSVEFVPLIVIGQVFIPL